MIAGSAGSGRGSRAFTLIELLVTMAVIALLLSLAAPRYFSSVSRAEETALKTNLALMRDAIDKYYADHGRYPASLEELADRKYIRSVPVDPLTRSAATWTVTAPTEAGTGQVYDVHSGASGNARDGSEFSRW